MADVTQKIIDGKAQPRDGRIVLQSPLAFASGYQTINPPVDKGLTVAAMETLYTSRFDRPRYYTSTPSGLAY
jgi:hypothetical protein